MRKRIVKIRNERDFISDTTEIQRIMRNEEQFYDNKFDKLECMDKFLEPAD